MNTKGKRVALVVGAASGIGKAVAKEFKAHGDTVIGTFRSVDPEDKIPEQVTEQIELDLASQNSVDSVCRKISTRPIDVVVICAGVFDRAWPEQYRDGDWKNMLMVNLIAPTRIIKAATAGMTNRQSPGRVVAISSIAAKKPRIGCVTYGTSKGSIQGLIRAIALDIAPLGILANTVSPGTTQTPMVTKALSPAEILDRANHIPRGRLAEPEEIAAVVEFLCSDKNTYITGQDIVVDGGETLA